MYPTVPGDILSGGWETLCYALTVVVALVSYLLCWR